MNPSLSSRFFKSLMKFSVASWVQAAIAFISVPIITRAFSPTEFGKINMFTIATGIFAIIVGLSMDQSYVRFFKEKESNHALKDMLTQLFSITFIAFICFCALIFLFGKPLSNYLFGEVNLHITYLAIPIMVLMTIISLYQNLYFRMSENALGYSVYTVLVVIVTKLILVLAAFISPTYTLAIYFSVAGLTLLVIGCFLYSRKTFDIGWPKIIIASLKPYLKYSIPLLPVSLVIFFNSAIVRILLKDYLSYEALGIFTASVTVANILSLIQSGFRIYWAPFMYSNYKTDQYFIKQIHSVVSFAMVFFSLLIIFSSDVIFHLLGEDFRSGKNIFALLLISPVVVTISETTCYGIYINKKTHLQLYSTAFSFFITIILGFTLIPLFGLLGAAITNAAGGIAFFVLRTFFGQKEYKSADKLFRTYCSIAILVFGGWVNYCWDLNTSVKLSMVFFLMVLLALIYIGILRRLPMIILSSISKFVKNIN